MSRDGSSRRRRKQPASRRTQVTGYATEPRLTLPKTAHRRRQRNRRQRYQSSLSFVRRLVFSARWISLALLGLTLYALYFVYTQPVFYLNSIPVVGAEVMPVNEVLQRSNLVGAHIFAADPNKAAQNIAGINGVISATVSLKWPNEVSITIGEDAPIAIWEENGEQYWVSESGVLIPARAEAVDLLVIRAEEATEAPEIQLGAPDEEGGNEQADTADSNDEFKFVPIEVVQGALQLRKLKPDLQFLYYRPAGGLSFDDSRGWRAYFGVSTDMAQKIVLYETLVAQLQENNQTPVYISVSNQEKPFYLAHGG